MKHEVNRPCLLCHSCKSDLAFSMQYPNFGYPEAFHLRRCTQCGLLFNSPRLTDEELRKLYENNYYFFNRSDHTEFQRILNVYRRTIKPLESQLSEQKDVLEVGSAKGYLLALLAELGWTTHGIELSQGAAAYSAEHFEIDVVARDLTEYASCADHRQFPVVLAIDVLEHVPDPSGFLEQAHEILKSSGILIIDTPNAGSLNIARVGTTWRGFNPYHIFLFNHENIEALLRKHGFRDVSSFSYGNSLVESEQKTAPDVREEPMRSGRTHGSLKNLRAYHAARKMAQRFFPSHFCKRSLMGTVRRANEDISFFDTPDSKGPLADSKQGDNLVVIARKRG